MKILAYRKLNAVCDMCRDNIKGILDHYRTPNLQKVFADQCQQNPAMVTSFAEGTKI